MVRAMFRVRVRIRVRLELEKEIPKRKRFPEKLVLSRG